MPTYNQAQWLPGALASIGSQSAREALTCFAVVVDDASTDCTPDLLPRTKALLGWAFFARHDANKGTAEGINTGVNLLGQREPGIDALSWVSSDNVMHPDWISELAKAIHGGAGAAYGGFYIVTPERVTYAFQKHERDKLLNDVNCYYGPAFLIRKDVWLEAGPHRGKISHDYDHWLRVEEVCYRRGLPIVGVDQPLCWYQAHEKRAGVVKAHEFDAHHWQAEARKRRAAT